MVFYWKKFFELWMKLSLIKCCFIILFIKNLKTKTMSKTTNNKKIELIASYDVNDSTTDSTKKRKEFVMRYMFEQVTFQHETKERFRFLDASSELRKRCELILKTHTLDNRNVRFEECLVYVLLIEKDSGK